MGRKRTPEFVLCRCFPVWKREAGGIMDDRQAADLYSVFSGVEKLESFFIASKPLHEDAGAFAEFAAAILPSVSCVALARLSHNGQALREFACWNGCSVEGGGPCRRLVEKRLEDMCRLARDQGQSAGELAVSWETEQDCTALQEKAAVFPVWRGGSLLGFVLFDRENGFFSNEEKQTLKTLAEIAGISFATKSFQEGAALQSWIYNSVMDNMSTNLYVTDVVTGKILFMNNTMKRAYGVQHPEGQVCWKVLQSGMKQRCPFCPVHLLLESPQPNPSYVWEEFSSVTHCTYEKYDSLMRWIDGRMVHFQQSVDVTESRRLTRTATLDELTQMLNRRSGKEALADAMRRAQRENTTVTLVLYDVNLLQSINETYGYTEGDQALIAIAQAMREQLEDKDFPFRLNGDEFIVVFYGKTEDYARRKMMEAQSALAEKRVRFHKPYDIGFCYGILEVHPDERTTPHEVLARVDEKMYEQKRRYHAADASPIRQPACQAGPLQAQAFAYNKDRLYDALVNSTDDYIFVSNMKTGMFQYPKAMAEEFNLPGEIVPDLGAVWESRVHKDDWKAFFEAYQEIVEGRKDTYCVEYRARSRKGKWVWLRCRGCLIRDGAGKPDLFAGSITNLGKKHKIDHLTGLFNKYEFEAQVTEQLRLCGLEEVSVLLLGMDDFRHINDLYDRKFGDEVIRAVARKLQGLLPEGAFLFRLDGDEFGVLMPNAPQEQVVNLYNAFRDSLKNQQELNEKKYYCTISGGSARYPKDGSSYQELFKCASSALEYTKSHGKNHLTFFSEDIVAQRSRELELVELLRDSVEHDYRGFALYYQPQVNASTRRMTGAEALARWSCEKYGPVSPVEFIPLLERSGLILPVGRWIFRQAVKSCKEWIALDPGFTISINLSCLQLSEPDLLDFMRDTLEQEGLPAENVVVELTESYIASSVESIRHLFSEIRGIGLQIAMDDFGTGYSALEILKDLPADIVKVDRAFVRDIRHSTFDATFIRFIVELCHDVGIKVCLEGVEQEEEYRIVQPMELDRIQGYLFGRPQPKELFAVNFHKKSL